MKIIRWLITISILVTVPTLFNIRALAYTAPNGQEYEYKYRVYNGSYVSDLYSNDELCLCTQSGYTQDGGYRTYVARDGYLYSVQFNYGQSVATGTAVYPNLSGSTSFSFGYLSTSINGDWACVSKNVNGYTELQTFSTYQASYEYLSTPRVDWDNPYYSPTMVIPEFEVNYDLIDSGETTPFMPCSVYLTNANSNLYCEVVCVNYMPSVVK